MLPTKMICFDDISYVITYFVTLYRQVMDNLWWRHWPISSNVPCPPWLWPASADW